jgi:hypothetical protein
LTYKISYAIIKTLKKKYKRQAAQMIKGTIPLSIAVALIRKTTTAANQDTTLRILITS